MTQNNQSVSKKLLAEIRGLKANVTIFEEEISNIFIIEKLELIEALTQTLITERRER